MLEVMPESTGKILWLRAGDKLTDQDYREVFTSPPGGGRPGTRPGPGAVPPGPGFSGLDAGGLVGRPQAGLKHRGDFEKVALVGAPLWADALMKLFAHFMPGEVRTFLREHLAEAWIWIQE